MNHGPQVAELAISHRLPVMTLGSVLGSLGVWQLLRAREADARHVPSGLFSGTEHVFAMAGALLVILVAVLAVLVGILAFVGRTMGHRDQGAGLRRRPDRRSR